jgi:hypothetical protein
MFRGYTAYVVLLAEALFCAYRNIIAKVVGLYQVFNVVCDDLIKRGLFYCQMILISIIVLVFYMKTITEILGGAQALVYLL